MPETMPARFHEEAAKQVAADMGLMLVTITHPEITGVIRIADNNETVTSRGNTFLPWPASIRLPGQNGQAKRGSISFFEVKGEVQRLLRVLKGKCELAFEIVSRDEPDDVWMDHDGLFLVNTEMVDLAITGEVVGYGADNDPWPKRRNTPSRSPGLFV